MKDRQKKMLRFLLSAEENLRIDDIAAAFGVGSRTVSRDLDHLENWLSLRGVFLERKTNRGIRILTYGKDPAEIMKIINTPESYFSDLSPEQRQNFIFLYLIYNSREVKIAELARTFFVSDTCVWNDLQQIESRIERNGLAFQRMKGVGVRILGDEKDLRMTFLKVFAAVFSTKSIIPYIYCVKEKQAPGIEVNKLNLLLENLKITGDHESVFNLVTLAEELLDFKFTVSGESFIYFYLVLAGQRIQSACLVNNPVLGGCHRNYLRTAAMVLEKLTDKTMSGEIPAGEIELLGLVFQISEWGDIDPERWTRIESFIPESAIRTSRKMISLLGERRKEYYYLDSGLENALSASLASLALRVEYRIPRWYEVWANVSDSTDWTGDDISAGLEEAVGDLLKSEMNLEADWRDIRSFFYHFQASEINPHQFLREKIRCLICCFEGIGLVSYLYSIIRHDFSDLEIVEATAVYKFNQRYLDLNRIDLVISTFPIPDIETPVLIVPLPVDRAALDKSIGSAVSKIKKEDQRHIKLPEIIKSDEKKISVNDVLHFIQNFSVKIWSRPFEYSAFIRKVAEGAADEKAEIRKIEKALLKREELGSLILPEFGIRIFHCKSSAVKAPRSGLFKLSAEDSGDADSDVNLLVYLIAPDPCPENIRLMLSAFTVALMERPILREILDMANEEKVRLGLFDLYHSLL